MLVDLAVTVQLVLADAVKGALSLPGHPWNAVHGPAHADDPVRGLPDAANLHIQLLEEDAAMETQAPENGLVVLHAGEAVARVPEGDVITVDVICSITHAVVEAGSGVGW